jgi:hypothetical protein
MDEFEKDSEEDNVEEVTTWQRPQEQYFDVELFILDFVWKLKRNHFNLTYEDKVSMETIAQLPSEINLRNSIALILINAMISILERVEDKKFRWKMDYSKAPSVEDMYYDLARMVVDHNGIHHCALNVICRHIIAIRDVNLLTKVSKAVRNSFQNADNVTKGAALEALSEIAVNIDVAQKEDIVRYFLDVIYTCKNRVIEQKAAYKLMKVTAGLSEVKRNEVITHVILLLRHEYLIHKDILYGLSQLWQLLPVEQKDNFIHFILTFLQHKNHHIRQGIARVFLEMDIQEISRDILLIIIRNLQRKLKKYELDIDVTRFALESLQKIYTCKNTDDTIKLEITKGIIARAKKEKK